MAKLEPVVKAMLEKRRGGFYWLDKTPYLSVTEILSVVDKSGSLMYWFGKEVYYAMLQEPSLSEKEALRKPYEKSGLAKERGTAVHSIVEAYKNTGDKIINLSENIRPYAQAYYNWFDMVKPKIIFNEKSLKSDMFMIAGTLDMYAEIGGKKVIIDVKTGKGIYQESGLQMSAYAEMMRENGHEIDGIYTLLLETGKDDKGTGKWIFQEMEDDFVSFRATKRLYEYINKEKLAKAGYGK